jgi:succinate dehydrogenase / fumarate reductase flavoprotein subunit
MSESLRNDGRIWVPAKLEDAQGFVKGKRNNTNCLKQKEIIILERSYPAFGNLVPRDIASRAAKERCDAGGEQNRRSGLFRLCCSIERYGKSKRM